jgi:hypothetical protein
MFNRNQAAVADALPAIKYNVPFEWGTLHVSEEAAEAYGLVPLTPDAVEPAAEPGLPKQLTDLPPTDILIAGPTEILERSSDVPMQSGKWLGGVLLSNVAKQGSMMTLGFLHDTDDLRKNVLDDATEHFGIDREHLAELVSDEGLSLESVVEHDVPQIFAHAIAQTLFEASAHLKVAQLEQQSSRRLKRVLVTSGAIAVAGTGVMLGIDTLVDNFSPLSMSVVGIYAGVQGMLIRTRYKRQKLISMFDKQIARLTGAMYGHQISSDVHAAFCRKLFDAKLEPPETDR